MKYGQICSTKKIEKKCPDYILYSYITNTLIPTQTINKIHGHKFYFCWKHFMPPVCSITQSFLTLCDPMDCDLPGSSVHGILHTRILERVAIVLETNPLQGHFSFLLVPTSQQEF